MWSNIAASCLPQARTGACFRFSEQLGTHPTSPGRSQRAAVHARGKYVYTCFEGVHSKRLARESRILGGTADYFFTGGPCAIYRSPKHNTSFYHFSIASCGLTHLPGEQQRKGSAGSVWARAELPDSTEPKTLTFYLFSAVMSPLNITVNVPHFRSEMRKPSSRLHTTINEGG